MSTSSWRAWARRKRSCRRQSLARGGFTRVGPAFGRAAFHDSGRRRLRMRSRQPRRPVAASAASKMSAFTYATGSRGNTPGPEDPGRDVCAPRGVRCVVAPCTPANRIFYHSYSARSFSTRSVFTVKKISCTCRAYGARRDRHLRPSDTGPPGALGRPAARPPVPDARLGSSDLR